MVLLKPSLYNTGVDLPRVLSNSGRLGGSGWIRLNDDQAADGDLRPIGKHDVGDFGVGHDVRDPLAAQGVG
jgi:hypothetical protein